MTRVLSYQGPRPHEGPPPEPPAVVLARTALVVLVIGQAFCFASDFAARDRVRDEFEDAWQRTEVMRRGHERDRRALGYQSAPPPAPPRRPVVRLALPPVLAWLRVPFTLAAGVFAFRMGRLGWPKEPPAPLRRLAITVATFAVVALVATVIADGIEFAVAPVVITSLRLIATAAAIAVVAPALGLGRAASPSS